MSLDFEIDEISTLLGIKNKVSEIENIIHKNEKPNFLSAIKLILKDPDSQNLIPNVNITQNNENEMFINFTEKLNIKDIQQIELKDQIKESKFEESIKTKNNIFKNVNLFFNQDYREKIKKDFIMPKEEEIQIIDASKHIQRDNNNQIKKEKKSKKQKNKQNSNTNQIIIENENNKINTSINNEKNQQTQNTKTFSPRLNINNMEEYSFKNGSQNNINNTINNNTINNNTIGNNKNGINSQNLNSINSNNNLSTAKFDDSMNEFQLSQMTNISERTKNLFQQAMENYAPESSMSTNKMGLSNMNNNFN